LNELSVFGAKLPKNADELLNRLYHNQRSGQHSGMIRAGKMRHTGRLAERFQQIADSIQKSDEHNAAGVV